jgi:hypothetical protein
MHRGQPLSFRVDSEVYHAVDLPRDTRPTPLTVNGGFDDSGTLVAPQPRFTRASLMRLGVARVRAVQRKEVEEAEVVAKTVVSARPRRSPSMEDRLGHSEEMRSSSSRASPRQQSTSSPQRASRDRAIPSQDRHTRVPRVTQERQQQYRRPAPTSQQHPQRAPTAFGRSASEYDPRQRQRAAVRSAAAGGSSRSRSMGDELLMSDSSERRNGSLPSARPAGSLPRAASPPVLSSTQRTPLPTAVPPPQSAQYFAAHDDDEQTIPMIRNAHPLSPPVSPQQQRINGVNRTTAAVHGSSGHDSPRADDAASTVSFSHASTGQPSPSRIVCEFGSHVEVPQPVHAPLPPAPVDVSLHRPPSRGPSRQLPGRVSPTMPTVSAAYTQLPTPVHAVEASPLPAMRESLQRTPGASRGAEVNCFDHDIVQSVERQPRPEQVVLIPMAIARYDDDANDVGNASNFRGEITDGIFTAPFVAGVMAGVIIALHVFRLPPPP